jgi:hypothetical protein
MAATGEPGILSAGPPAIEPPRSEALEPLPDARHPSWRATPPDPPPLIHAAR